MSGEALEAEVAAMESLKENYANPVFRIPITLFEIVPVGLLIALISAALLRNPAVLPTQSQMLR